MPFMEPEVSLPCSQELACETYPEPDESSSPPHTLLQDQVRYSPPMTKSPKFFLHIRFYILIFYTLFISPCFIYIPPI
jgi:hypothetical protein